MNYFIPRRSLLPDQRRKTGRGVETECDVCPICNMRRKPGKYSQCICKISRKICVICATLV